MSNLELFRSDRCPRCEARQFFRLGDGHYTVTPLVQPTHHPGAPQAAPDLTCYVKACRNCAYVEFFSKFLIDDFEATLAAIDKFGVISRTPGGDYLVSIFREYEHRGTRAKDFTVPLSSEQWFELCLVLDDLSDSQVVRSVLHGPYLAAWKERVGPVPPDLARDLRALVSDYRSGVTQFDED